MKARSSQSVKRKKTLTRSPSKSKTKTRTASSSFSSKKKANKSTAPPSSKTMDKGSTHGHRFASPRTPANSMRLSGLTPPSTNDRLHDDSNFTTAGLDITPFPVEYDDDRGEPDSIYYSLDSPLSTQSALEGNISVYCRFRPAMTNEIEGGMSLPRANAPYSERNRLSILDHNKREHVYTFDHVFDTYAAQEEIYNLIAQPILNQVFNGYDGTIMAYGQTSSGKTFTMEGHDFDALPKSLFARLSSSHNMQAMRGIIPR